MFGGPITYERCGVHKAVDKRRLEKADIDPELYAKYAGMSIYVDDAIKMRSIGLSPELVGHYANLGAFKAEAIALHVADITPARYSAYRTNNFFVYDAIRREKQGLGPEVAGGVAAAFNHTPSVLSAGADWIVG